jgi:hypothetical protein
MMCASRSRPTRLRFGAGKPSRLADNSPRFWLSSRVRARGVEFAQLGTRERGALRAELLESLAELAQPRRGHRWRVGFGAQRGMLLHWFAGVVEGERELAIIHATGRCELLDRQVLVVTLDHPPTGTRK